LVVGYGGVRRSGGGGLCGMSVSLWGESYAAQSRQHCVYYGRDLVWWWCSGGYGVKIGVRVRVRVRVSVR